jgi:single-strand DNA-binding protein
MAFEIEGKLVKIYPTEQKTASFSVREFVIEVPDGNYPQMVKFQTSQERCSVMDNYREGEKIKVSFDLRGREWQGKYFTTLNAWRVDKVGDNSDISATDNSFPEDPFPSMEPPRAPSNNSNGGGGFDDLPF